MKPFNLFLIVWAILCLCLAQSCGEASKSHSEKEETEKGEKHKKKDTDCLARANAEPCEDEDNDGCLNQTDSAPCDPDIGCIRRGLLVDTTGKPTGPGTPIDCYNRFLIDFSNSFIGVNINLTISIWDKFGEKIHDLPVKHTGLFSKDEKGVFVPFDWMNNDTIPLGAVSLIAQYPPMKEIIGCELPDYFTILFLGHETTSNKKELVYYYEKTVCGF